jgi:hypothetical protein
LYTARARRHPKRAIYHPHFQQVTNCTFANYFVLINLMVKSPLLKGILIAALAILPAALPVSALAQNNDDNKTVGRDIKDAGHATKEAGKKTGHETKKETKKVVHKSAHKTGDAADKVEDKTQDKDKPKY